MFGSSKKTSFLAQSKRYGLLLGIFWTVVVAGSLVWNIIQDRKALLESARIQARAAFEKDVVYRRWNASLGGVYVPVTDKVPPNPYLSFMPERDIVTTDGKRLTLMNPAWMTRKVHELAAEAYGVRSHITSLKPVRPENAADPWETEALKAFEQGEPEISSLEVIDGVEHMRLMRPLITEKSCLKCHARHGYKEGDIRGGISVSVRMEPLWAIMRTHVVTVGLVHGLLWLLGMGGLFVGAVWFGRSERRRAQAEEELGRISNLDRERVKEIEKSYAELQQSQDAAINLMEDLTAEISERKKAEEELRASKEYAQNLIDSSLDMIIAVDKKRRITEFNRAAEATFGHKKVEVLGKHINMLYANVEEGRQVHRQTIENGHLVQEILYKRKNGETFPSLLAASVLIDEEGNLAGVMGVSRDISEQKAAERALRESEEKFRGVIEQSNDGIYVLQGKRFVFINPRFTEITGYELGEISGEDFDFRQLLAEEGLQVLEEREAMRRAGETPPSRYVFKAILKDGRQRDLEVSVAIVEWQGDPAVLGVLRDVTERIEARKKLEQALEKAQEGERVKTLFLANMSHEIRTPLNAILGFTDLLEERVTPFAGSEERGFLDTIRGSGERLTRTIHEILDMSQIEAGTFAMELEELDLVKLALETTVILRPQAEKKGLKLSFTSDVPQGLIEADGYCVAQALINIVDNAIKYTEEGRIDIWLREKDSQFVLSIRDTGIGISKEYLDQIFEVFTQESTGYTKRFQGVGLGLALTKRYLELCGAAIDVQSDKGTGSTFTLTFQKAKKVAPKRARKPKAEPPKIPVPEPERKPLVLVVEDDVSSQKLLSFYLKKCYDSCFAVSVEEAKQVMESEAIALILLDLSLVGNEDGLDLARYLRKTKKWKGIPIIAVTAHAFETDRENCLAAGCNDYLSKPIKQGDLLEKVERWLRMWK